MFEFVLSWMDGWLVCEWLVFVRFKCLNWMLENELGCGARWNGSGIPQHSAASGER
ncbi:unnamed protein product [Coffea canephora]|uniref:Uncharacterized protein n=1 Tax=Coffea canephora TaxID=49390 RepID=A0A068U6D3_COFCA|nr:unnamed protein product [Coffea canephora]